MSKTIHSTYISKRKSEAKKLSSEKNIKQTEALDIIARNNGFKGWHDLTKYKNDFWEMCFFAVDDKLIYNEDVSPNQSPFVEICDDNEFYNTTEFINKISDYDIDFEYLSLLKTTNSQSFKSIGDFVSEISKYCPIRGVEFVIFKGELRHDFYYEGGYKLLYREDECEISVSTHAYVD